MKVKSRYHFLQAIHVPDQKSKTLSIETAKSVKLLRENHLLVISGTCDNENKETKIFNFDWEFSVQKLSGQYFFRILCQSHAVHLVIQDFFDYDDRYLLRILTSVLQILPSEL